MAKFSRKCSAERRLSAPSQTLAAVTWRAFVARARSSMRRTMLRTKAVSCIAGGSQGSSGFLNRGELKRNLLDRRLDGLGNHGRQRAAGFELPAFDEIGDEEGWEPTEAARQLDGFGEPERMGRTGRESDRERFLARSRRWIRPGSAIGATASTRMTASSPSNPPSTRGRHRRVRGP